MQHKFISIAGIIGALGVALGAFGAHALKKIATADALATFETGVKYQMLHTLLLLAIGLLSQHGNSHLLKRAGQLTIAGILLFSGSLYVLTAQSITKIEALKFAGPITPLGGLCFIAAWLLVAFSYKHQRK